MGNVLVLKHTEKPKKEGLYYYLLCLTGPNKGQSYYLSEKRIVIGRGDTADIQLLDSKSSREHAEIVYANQNYYISDLSSNNGVVINDLKIKQHRLSVKDKIIIGTTVFRFSLIKVEPELIPQTPKALSSVKKTSRTLIRDATTSDSEQKSKPKANVMILIVALLAIALLLFDNGNESQESGKSTVKSNYDTNDITGDLSSIERKKRLNSPQAKKLQAQLETIYARGLREYREGNFFRAMGEFNLALNLSPNDSQAAFYLRKTKEALDSLVREYKLTASRDIEALHYQKATISYCAIIRLLHNYPNDVRYEETQKDLRLLEEKMGLENGEIECIKK